MLPGRTVTWAPGRRDRLTYRNKSTLAARVARVFAFAFCEGGDGTEWKECFLSPWPDRRGGKCACKLCEHDSCKVISRPARRAAPPRPRAAAPASPSTAAPTCSRRPELGVRAMFRS